MSRRPGSLFLFLQAFTLIALYITQQIGFYYFDQDPNNGFFAISHILGGIWVAFAVSWLLALMSKRPSMIACVILALLVGVVWEYFEVVAFLTYPEFPGYISDTISDLVMDTLGGLLGAIIALRIAMRR